MNEELGIYILPDSRRLRFDTYCLKLLGKHLGKTFEETFNAMATITQSLDVVEGFIICGAKSESDAELTSREACKIIDSLGGINGAKFMELCLFVIKQYIPETEKKAEPGITES